MKNFESNQSFVRSYKFADERIEKINDSAKNFDDFIAEVNEVVMHELFKQFIKGNNNSVENDAEWDDIGDVSKYVQVHGT